MSIFGWLFGSKKRYDSYAYRLEQAKSLHGQDVKYVTEYVDGNDNVVGRGGSVCLKDDVLIIDSSGDRLFMCEVGKLGINQLMSGNGVIITGPNMLENGNVRVLTVHFVYYRR